MTAALAIRVSNKDAARTACDFCGERPAIWACTDAAACSEHLILGLDADEHLFVVLRQDRVPCGEVVYRGSVPAFVCGEPFGTEHSHESDVMTFV